MPIFSPDDVPDYRARLSLAGRRVMVLGGGAGIGRQTVHALTQLGAAVACIDRDMSLATAVADESGATAHQCDAVDPDDLSRCFTEASEMLGGPPTGVVDIIGAAWISTLADMKAADWEFQLNVNLRHAINVGQIAGSLSPTPTSMAFVGSISGLRHVPRQGAYGVVKAALHQLVRAMADEMGPSGTRVNAVAPGWTRTPRLVETLGEEKWRTIDAEIPRGYAGDSSEIAGPLAFLMSVLSSYVTGQVLVVDGGLTNAQTTPRIF
jgi:NAD(P)-dependent dehydrogenase (short-subunit alcohol dehydrogenase family)